MTDEGQIDGETHYEKDSNGDIVHKPDVVSAENLSTDDIQRGKVERTQTLAGASDGTTDTSNSVDIDVPFDTEFDSAPHVVATVDYLGTSNDQGIDVLTGNESVTGFTLRLRNISSLDSSQQRATWIAIEA